MGIATQYSGFARPAYQMIEYPEYLGNTMKYVFGGTFVCSSTEIAKKVAFDHQIARRCRCVNMEGDITDPKGTLTGGFMANKAMLLTKYAMFQNVRAQYI